MGPPKTNRIPLEPRANNRRRTWSATHTWWFPSLRVAHILLPKRPEPGVEAAGDLISTAAVGRLVFQDALNDIVGRLENGTKSASRLLDYNDLAPFPTRCVEVCHDALDGQQHAPLR